MSPTAAQVQMTTSHKVPRPAPLASPGMGPGALPRGRVAHEGEHHERHMEGRDYRGNSEANMGVLANRAGRPLAGRSPSLQADTAPSDSSILLSARGVGNSSLSRTAPGTTPSNLHIHTRMPSTSSVARLPFTAILMVPVRSGARAHAVHGHASRTEPLGPADGHRRPQPTGARLLKQQLAAREGAFEVIRYADTNTAREAIKDRDVCSTYVPTPARPRRPRRDGRRRARSRGCRSRRCERARRADAGFACRTSYQSRRRCRAHRLAGGIRSAAACSQASWSAWPRS